MNDDDMKTKLIDLLSKNNPKSFTRLLNSRPEMSEYVKTYSVQWATENINETLYCLVNEQTPALCPCGKKALFNSFSKGYRKFCARTCKEKGKEHSKKVSAQWEDRSRVERMVATYKQTCLEKYGVENAALDASVREKTKKTNLDKYGVEFPFQSDAVRGKASMTLRETHGVNTPFESEELREKASATFIKKHGSSNKMQFARKKFADDNNNQNPFQVEWVKDKITDAMLTKYGVAHPLQHPDIVKRMQEKYYQTNGVRSPFQLHINRDLYEILHDKARFVDLISTNTLSEITDAYNCSVDLIYDYHDKHELSLLQKATKSRYEDEIEGILIDLGIKFQKNSYSIISPYQLDFYIPEHNLAIEFNGLYWHSERTGGKDKHYHAMKTSACQSKGIQLLTIFEDEWKTHREIIIKHIKHLCRLTKVTVGARKIEMIRLTDRTEVDNFLIKHHIQGKTDRYSIACGGRLNGHLVAVFLLANTNNVYEIVRYCSDFNASYPGLFSKFIKFACSISNIEKLTTIADLRWSQGDIYLKSGFNLVSKIKPDYQYTDCKSFRSHKFNYRKSRIASVYGLDISGKTELELTSELGLDRIWDCGKLKFEMVINK